MRQKFARLYNMLDDKEIQRSRNTRGRRWYRELDKHIRSYKVCCHFLEEYDGWDQEMTKPSQEKFELT